MVINDNISNIVMFTSSLIHVATFFRPCSDGYYGLKCRLHCPFPDSEEGCVLQCKCSKEIHGCTTLQGTACFIKYIFGLVLKDNSPYHYHGFH